MNIAIQSNVIKGEYKNEIVERTMNEIYEAIKTAYGPFATDNFINKNGTMYLTRDGKEIFNSLSFSNELSIKIAAILNQAVERQAHVAGDGTTTLILFYISLYRRISKDENLKSYCASIIRKTFIELINKIVTKVKEQSIEIKTTDEIFKSMIYTCTQDVNLIEQVYDIMKKADKDTFISVGRTDEDDRIVVEKHDYPVIKVRKGYSLFSIPDSGELKNCVTLFVDGQLNIECMETLYFLASEGNYTQSKKNIIIFCGGISDSTRKSLNELNAAVNNDNKAATGMNNIIIFKLEGYMGYSTEMREDISCVVYNVDKLCGLQGSEYFESMILKTLISPENQLSEKVASKMSLDITSDHIERVQYSFSNKFNAIYDIEKGLKMEKPLNEKTTTRLNELKESLVKEKSEINRNIISQRLRSLYGTFVEVKVGSRLMKDSQREYELILDAVVSSQAALKYGVLTKNSLIVTLKVLNEMFNTETDELKLTILNILIESTLDTLNTLICNKIITNITDERKNALLSKIIEKSDFSNINLYNKITHVTNIKDKSSEIWYDINVKKLFNDEHVEIDDGKNNKINIEIVEPTSIIENILINSTTALDMALSSIYVVNSFMDNYI